MAATTDDQGMIILDTTVVAELIRTEPDGAVQAWVASCDPDGIFVTAITYAEVLHGIERMVLGKRKRLTAALANHVFFTVMEGRILPFDQNAAPYFARLAMKREKSGPPILMSEAMIASIAWANSAQVATRADTFKGYGVPVVNPWAA